MGISLSMFNLSRDTSCLNVNLFCAILRFISSRSELISFLSI